MKASFGKLAVTFVALAVALLLVPTSFAQCGGVRQLQPQHVPVERDGLLEIGNRVAEVADPSHFRGSDHRRRLHRRHSRRQRRGT